MQRYIDELDSLDLPSDTDSSAVHDDDEAGWGGLTSEDRDSAEERRDQIAKAMWEDYVTELQRRGYA
jgi:hypothetical protein